MAPAEVPVHDRQVERDVDPAALVARTVATTDRLREAFRLAHQRFRDVGDTLDQEVATLMGAESRGDRRVVVRRAEDAEALLTGLVEALAAARDQAKWNAEAVADIRAQLARAEASLLVRDIEALAMIRERLLNLTVPQGELEVAISEAVPYIPAFQAAASRRIHAAAIATRRLYVDAVTRRLAALRDQHQAVAALRHATDPHDEALTVLLGRAAQRAGAPLHVPTVDWPVAGKAGDPFAGPVLKD